MHWLEEGDVPAGGDGRGFACRVGESQPPGAPIGAAALPLTERQVRPTESRGEAGWGGKHTP